MKKLLVVTALLLTSSLIKTAAQNVIPDSLFGVNAIFFSNPGASEYGSNLLLQYDGNVIYGAYDYDISQNDYHNDMVRLNACGLTDSTFGTNGIVHHKFEQRNQGFIYHLQDDGKILCGGIQATSNAGSQQFPFVARYNADGSVDTAFATGGSNKISFDANSAGSIYSIATLPDGRIVCTGTCNCGGGGVIRLLPDGTPDSTFSGDGKALQTFSNFSAYSEVYGHVLQNGKTILTGATWDGSFIDHYVSFCFDSTGTLDTTFGMAGFFTDTTQLDVYTYGLATGMNQNEQIVMAANRPSLNGIEVVRINPNGTIDNAFGVSGHVSLHIAGTTVKNIKILNNGYILLMGSYSPGNSAFGFMLKSDGSNDSTFGTNGFRVFDMNNGAGNGNLVDLLELPSGKWIAATTANNGLQLVQYTQVSNVPHISQVFNQLQTTGSGSFQWFMNGNLIPGANGNSYTFTQNGTYSVTLTDSSGCSYTSDPFTVTNSSLAETEAAGFMVYPNPASGMATVTYSGITGNNCYLRLFDSRGREVFKQLLDESLSMHLNTTAFANGVYALQLSGIGFYRVQKLVIQHE